MDEPKNAIIEFQPPFLPLTMQKRPFDLNLSFLFFLFLNLSVTQMLLLNLEGADFRKDYVYFALSSLLHALLFSSIVALVLNQISKPLIGGIAFLVSLSPILEWVAWKYFQLHVGHGLSFFWECYKHELMTFQIYIVLPILGSVLLLASLLFGSTKLYRWTVTSLKGFHWRVSNKGFSLSVLLILGLLAGEQYVGSKVMSQRAKTSQLLIPLTVSSFFPYRNEKALARFDSVSFPSLPSESIIETRLKELSKNPLQNKPNIFIFIIDSFRSDVVNESLMPNLYALKNDAVPMGRFIAGSNSTHPSWFSLFYSSNPLYWPMFVNLTKGSTSLRIFKALGYKMHAFTSMSAIDSGFFNIRTSLFGENNSLLDSYAGYDTLLKDSPQKDFATADENILTRLNHILDSTQNNTGGLYIVSLNALHWKYEWTAKFAPPLADISREISGVALSELFSKPELLFGRYKNSAAFTDALIGSFLKKLKSKNLYSDSVILVMGDHGEEFGESGFLRHATALDRPQLETPIVLHLPKSLVPAEPRKHDQTSHFQIFPTLLNLLGRGAETKDLLMGEPWWQKKQLEDAPVVSVEALTTYPKNFRVFGKNLAADFEVDDLGGYNNTLAAKTLRIMRFTDGLDHPVEVSKKEAAIWGSDVLNRLGIKYQN